MGKPNFLVDVDVSNLEASIATLEEAIHQLEGTMEELLKQIRLGTGLITGTDLKEEDDE